MSPWIVKEQFYLTFKLHEILFWWTNINYSLKTQICVWSLKKLNFKFMVNENSLQPLLWSNIYANHFYQ